MYIVLSVFNNRLPSCEFCSETSLCLLLNALRLHIVYRKMYNFNLDELKTFALQIL